MKTAVQLLLLISSFLLFCSIVKCSSAYVLTKSERMYHSADSLLHAEDFVHAQKQYENLARQSSNREIAQKAQFMSAYVHLYYKNPFGDWKKALTELEKYRKRYPKGEYIDRALTWIDFLHSIVSYETGYEQSRATSKNLKTTQTQRFRKYVIKDSLINEQKQQLQRCRHRNALLDNRIDSLRIRIDNLQNTIIELQ